MHSALTRSFPDNCSNEWRVLIRRWNILVFTWELKLGHLLENAIKAFSSMHLSVAPSSKILIGPVFVIERKRRDTVKGSHQAEAAVFPLTLCCTWYLSLLFLTVGQVGLSPMGEYREREQIRQCISNTLGTGEMKVICILHLRQIYKDTHIFFSIGSLLSFFFYLLDPISGLWEQRDLHHRSFTQSRAKCNNVSDTPALEV